MTAQERRAAIVEVLSRSHQPVSAGALARRFGVSRQLIVGDVALLRAGGEAVTATAEDEGLRRREALFLRRPVATTVQERRDAIAALLQIDGDSLTPEAINRTISGCGINALALEKGRFGYIRVIFPNVIGIPEGFEQLRRIIEEILPCHLQVEYVYWYITWGMVEEKFGTWETLGEGDWSWEEIEKMVR